MFPQSNTLTYIENKKLPSCTSALKKYKVSIIRINMNIFFMQLFNKYETSMLYSPYFWQYLCM